MGYKSSPSKSMMTALELAGVFIILSGILIVAIYGTLEFIGLIYDILGFLLIIMGAYWVYKLRKLERKYGIRRGGGRTSYKTYMVTLLLATLIGVFSVGGVYASGPEYSPTCLTIYQRVEYLEYTLLGLLLVSGFLAFAPIIFGRTILGPIFQELQYLAGAMLILLIFALLVIYPLDPMFVFDGDTPNSSTGCYVDISNLEDQGPPVLQLILRIFSPPSPTFT